MTTSPDSRYQTLQPRFLAGFVDGLILLPFGIVDALIFTQDLVWLSVTWIPITYSAYWIYSVVGHGFYGQTVGKRVMKIIVLDNKTEEKITMRQAVLRDLFLIVINILAAATDIYFVLNKGTEFPQGLLIFSLVLGYGSMAWFLTEIVTCLTNKKSRALHDFIAGTVVVKLEEEKLPTDPESLSDVSA